MKNRKFITKLNNGEVFKYKKHSFVQSSPIKQIVPRKEYFECECTICGYMFDCFINPYVVNDRSIYILKEFENDNFLGKWANISEIISCNESITKSII